MPVFNIRYETVRAVVFVYCGLPVLIFLAFWLKPVVAVLACATFAIALVLCMRRNDTVKKGRASFESPFERCTRALSGGKADPSEPRVITLSLAWIIVAVIIVIAWCILGGQGGMWYQSGDWDSRNALFRDLMTHKWPVRYESDGAWLCYYIGHWLPAAFAGKIMLRLGLALPTVWKLANILLLVWTAIGVFLVLVLLQAAVKPRKAGGRIVCLLLPILFATPDLIGMLLTGTTETALQKVHLEWWASNMQFSSLTTCLFWVFNQTVIPWMCTLVFVNERTPSRYLPLWAACLFAGPLPAIGLCVLMLAQGIAALVEGRGKRGGLLKEACSLKNALSLPAIAVLAIYFLSSSATSGELAESWSLNNMLPSPFYLPAEEQTLILALVFIAVEALLIPLLLRLAGVRGPLLFVVAALLVLCPLIRFNSTADFCMRVSIPAVMILCALSAKVLTALFEGAMPKLGRRIAACALIVVLAFGAYTPIIEFYRGFASVAEKGIEASVNDPFITFEGKSGWPRSNFTVQDGGDGEPLFKLIAQ